MTDDRWQRDEADELRADIAVLAMEVHGALLHEGGGSVPPEWRSPDPPVVVPVATLRKLRRALAEFVKQARAADQAK